MTIDRMIELLKIEHECMLRGSHNTCDRNCENCELVQNDYELDEMYTSVINLLQERKKARLDIAHDMITGSILMYQGKKLVRCKDCKNRNDSLRCPLELLKEQLKYTKVFTYNIPDDWFCADGVEKDG